MEKILAVLLAVFSLFCFAASAEDKYLNVIAIGGAVPADAMATSHMIAGPESVKRNTKAAFDRVKVPKGKDWKKMKAVYERQGFIVEIDELMKPDGTVTPNDPNFPTQWHLTKIQCPLAWGTSTGNASVIVAVGDTGFDPTHPDLKDNYLALQYNSADGGSITTPLYSHGTKVAGCIAEVMNNNLQGSGVAPNCKILRIRITNDPSGLAYTSSMANAITFAADHGANIINISYSGGLSQTVQSAATYARSRNVSVCYSAGNDGADLSGGVDPAQIIYSSATDGNDQRASFSSFGNYVDVASPGVSIPTCLDNGGYGAVSGTSFSSPITAGVLALIYSANPGISVDAAEAKLFASCDNVGSSTYFGYGRINAARALGASTGTVAPPIPPPPTPTPTITPQPTITPPVPPPVGSLTAPTGFRALVWQGGSRAQLDWKNSGAYAVEIQQSTNGGLFVTVATAAVGSVRYNFYLSPTKTYQFKIRHVSGTTYSAFSNVSP